MTKEEFESLKGHETVWLELPELSRPMKGTIITACLTDISSKAAYGFQHIGRGCWFNSIEYLKKYGLRGLVNLNTVSKPAKSASVLTGHINTFLASMQAYYAGALGLGYVNVFYAPFLVGKTDKELHQIAQELVFNCSQNAFSRGSQSLFIDINCCTGIPYALKDTLAIGPGGKYLCKMDDVDWHKGELYELEEFKTEDGTWGLRYPSPDDDRGDRRPVRRCPTQYLSHE